jgi:hypothetical protein
LPSAGLKLHQAGKYAELRHHRPAPARGAARHAPHSFTAADHSTPFAPSPFGKETEITMSLDFEKRTPENPA